MTSDSEEVYDTQCIDMPPPITRAGFHIALPTKERSDALALPSFRKACCTKEPTQSEMTNEVVFQEVCYVMI